MNTALHAITTPKNTSSCIRYFKAIESSALWIPTVCQPMQMHIHHRPACQAPTSTSSLPLASVRCLYLQRCGLMICHRGMRVSDSACCVVRFIGDCVCSAAAASSASAARALLSLTGGWPPGGSLGDRPSPSDGPARSCSLMAALSARRSSCRRLLCSARFCRAARRA